MLELVLNGNRMKFKENRKGYDVRRNAVSNPSWDSQVGNPTLDAYNKSSETVGLHLKGSAQWTGN